MENLKKMKSFREAVLEIPGVLENIPVFEIALEVRNLHEYIQFRQLF